MISDPLTPLIGGVTQGSILFLVALGFSLTLGVMRLLNLANGGFFLVGAYVSATLFSGNTISTPALVVSVIAGALAAGAAGVCAERLVVRTLYDLPHLYPMLGTFGLLLVIQGLVIARWGVQPVNAKLPDALTGFITIRNTVVPVYYLLIICVGLVFVAGFGITLGRTAFGRAVHATARDRSMAAMLGINTGRMFLATFALSAAAAGTGGALTGALTGLTPDLAFTLVIEAFAVVVIGGYGSILGTYLAALGVGILQAFLIILAPEYAEVSVYAALAAVMLLRPQGLMGRADLVDDL